MRHHIQGVHKQLINYSLLAIDDCINRLLDAYRRTNEPSLITHLDEIDDLRYELEREISQAYLQR